MNIQTATTKELVDFYNANCARFGLAPVKRFSDRAAAEKRTQKVVDLIEEHTEVVEGFSHCPHCGVHLSNGVWSNEQFKAEFPNAKDSDGTINRCEKFEFFCMGCGEEFGPEIKKTTFANSPLRAAAVKGTWKDPQVAAKRATRHAVRVTNLTSGKVAEFTSVRNAFIGLGWPLNKHISFRMTLKQLMKIDDQGGYKWELIER